MTNIKKWLSHVTSNDTERLTGKFEVTAQYQKESKNMD
jgi:hypothetical protein